MTVVHPKTAVCISVVAFLTMTAYIDGFGSGYGGKRALTLFCYNAPLPSSFQSGCVYCDFLQFPATALTCTGSSAIKQNMTNSEIFCIISNCIQQVKRGIIPLGRKKRAADAEEFQVEEESRTNETYVVAERIEVFIEPDDTEDI